LFALAASLANVVGGVIVTSHKWALRSLRYFVALGSGFMLGAIFLEMVPESMRMSPVLTGRFTAPATLILLGYLIVHAFEHTFASHLHFGEETHHDEVTNPVVGISALVGMLVHTYFDGVAIGVSFLVSDSVGTLVFLAVLLHKIPDGFTIASIAMSSGYSKAKALSSAVALGVSTLLGVISIHVLPAFKPYALPISAGSLLYVAATDLMPEVNHEKGVKMALVVFAGIGLFLLLQIAVEG
jgi:ZIP family zinc transporter/zinc and cadmium transporter